MARLASLLLTLVALGTLACAREAAEAPKGPPAATLELRSENGVRSIRWNDEALGTLRGEPTRWELRGTGVVARFEQGSEALREGSAYPRRVWLRGQLDASGAGFEQRYTELAPPSPLWIEGFGLEVADDPPGLNADEHEGVRRWLGEQGLPADTAPFEALHRADAGRELHVWYEVSGRRVDGHLTALEGGEPLGTFDSMFRTEGGALKIHHQRPGENGRFTYHRKSLELADTFVDPSGAEPPLHAHECGCYGYGIAADLMTLGSRLYRVEADWQDDRVAAEFFIGFEARDGFPWIGLGDRRRMRDLARRVRAYDLKDAEGEPFAQLALALPADPPSPELGPITYRLDRFRAGERAPLAVIAHRSDAITIALYGQEPPQTLLARLDMLLAAMPAQVQRGDGVRDSHLAEIERLVDYARFLADPGAATLADVVSDIDAASLHRKIAALLEGLPGTFLVDAEALPPPPARGHTRVGARAGTQVGTR